MSIFFFLEGGRPKTNLNLGIKTEPLTVEVDALVYVWQGVVIYHFLRFSKMNTLLPIRYIFISSIKNICKFCCASTQQSFYLQKNHRDQVTNEHVLLQRKIAKKKIWEIFVKIFILSSQYEQTIFDLVKVKTFFWFLFIVSFKT